MFYSFKPNLQTNHIHKSYPEMSNARTLKKEVQKLIAFLQAYPNNNSVGELRRRVPNKNVSAFVQQYQDFFELYEDGKVKRVRIRQFVTKTGFIWRTCVPFHFGGKCPRGKACGYRHGSNDAREPEARKNKSTAVINNTVQDQPVTAAPQHTNAQPTSSPVNKPAAVEQGLRIVEGKCCYLVPQEKRCAEIMDDLISQEIIAVDCEGVGLGTGGTLCLIQIATSANVYVFDLCTDTTERNTIINALQPVFKSTTIKKILHSATNDNVALKAEGIANENFEDTQVLYQELINLRRESKKTGLESLMLQYGFDHELKKKMKNVYKRNPAVWSVRPLKPEMIRYAALDVANLAKVYAQLKADIEHVKNNPVPEPLQPLQQMTFAAAISIPNGTIARLFFTEDKKVVRRLPSDITEEIAPKTNAEEMSERVRIDNQLEEQKLLDLFPDEVKEVIKLKASSAGKTLIEIVIDLGRAPTLLFIDSTHRDLDNYVVMDVDPFVRNVLDKSQRNDFSRDNRIGIEKSLHRISAIKNSESRVIGLTYRIGRHFPHSAEIFTDLVARVAREGTSILLLGKPGKGKTTLLREFSRLLADEYAQRVMIIDTSNEIGGDGDIAHKCIGRARRMPVIDKSFQHNTMVEAVQNHNPTVIVIDEIGTPKEAAAAKTISNRGVALIGTAHGSDFDSLMKNPELVPLLGGIREVFLSDKEATKNKDGSKSKVKHERGGAPTFGVIVEIVEKNQFVIYDNVAGVVDNKLNRKPYRIERRWFVDDQMYCKFEEQNSWE